LIREKLATGVWLFPTRMSTQKTILRLIPSALLGTVGLIMFLFVPPRSLFIRLALAGICVLTPVLFLMPLAGRKTAASAGLFVFSFIAMHEFIAFDWMNTALLLAFVLGFRLLIQ